MDTQICPHCGETIASDVEACPACGHLHVEANCMNHSDRKAEGECVICGDPVCAECNKGGDTHFLCEVHGGIPVEQGWAQVYSAGDDLEAQLIRDHLEAEGLDARVLSQKDHYAVPVDLGDLSAVRVLVPAYDYIEASDLIRSHTEPDGSVSFADDSEEMPSGA
jgi:hypothetical protein